MSCTVCRDCTLEDITSSAAAAIIRLEHAGRPDLASEVRSGATSAMAALVRAGLRKVTKKSPDVVLAASTDAEATLHHYLHRTWVGITEPVLKALDAREGDAIVARVQMVDGAHVETIGILGSEHRVWLLEYVDPEHAEAVTLRRKRRV